ncbi:hypothetical protein [Streptomyces californicus]|uniref:hypothetical protein n=1 Tax=Streptomyces californicus TaxID=67351 RepID=UPI00371CB92E
MAWDEWEQLKADAATRQPTRTQLNHLPPEPSGGGGSLQGDLAVNQTDLAAIGDAANHLDFTKGAHAGDEVHIAGTVSSIATLDAGFSERKSS